MAEERNCELCNVPASIYCPCDSAYLCRTCDRKVHSANFLVARHLRSCLCSVCGNLAGGRFSGAGVTFPSARNGSLCSSCLPESFAAVVEVEIGSISSSSSASCVSSTTDADEEATSSKTTTSSSMLSSSTTTTKTRGGAKGVDYKVEGVLVNWCRKMGVDERRVKQVVSNAIELIGDCTSRMTILPFRVAVTTSFWIAMRVCSGGGSATCRDLRRLEQISGVPAKLVLAMESRVVVKRRRSREDHVEGWAEC